MNTIAKETNKTQAMLYLENKRKANLTEQSTGQQIANGMKSEIISLPLYKLNVTETSQRDKLNKKKINDIIKDFDPNLLGIITVSYRDGKWYIIDGQHRAIALNTIFGDEYLVDRKVIRNIPQQKESAS